MRTNGHKADAFYLHAGLILIRNKMLKVHGVSAHEAAEWFKAEGASQLRASGYNKLPSASHLSANVGHALKNLLHAGLVWRNDEKHYTLTNLGASTDNLTDRQLLAVLRRANALRSFKYYADLIAADGNVLSDRPDLLAPAERAFGFVQVTGCL